MKLSKSKILTLILAPFVFTGLYLVVRNAGAVKTYAVDPLVVTYAGGPPPSPMFIVSDMLPGDEVEKDFNVKNDSPDAEGVTMDGVKTEELKNFASILDITITQNSTTLFDGKLQAFFDSPPIDLGSFPAGNDKTFKVKVKFPSSAGNEFQGAKVVFNIIWTTGAPPLDLPLECEQLRGVITRVVEGTEGNDWIFGNRESELILGKGGNDKILASKGDDCIVGGDGNDSRLDGSDGNDIIIGGPGNDHIDGSDNNDILYGNDGNDKIDGSDNNDLIYGGNGNDNIDGGGDQDKIYGEDGNDNIEGGSGNDEIYGGVGNDMLDGESGNDKVYGEDGNDTLKGGPGLDFLDGGIDTDNLNGGSGSDTCTNGESNTSCEL